jgi:hypothetical protein
VKWGFGMWKADAMQCIWIARMFALAAALGAAAGLPHADSKGVMLFIWHVAMATGLLLGERTCYWIWKDKIAQSDAWDAEHPL